MLASRLPGILPPMTEEEALESAAIQSVGSNGFDVRNWKKRPFRAPHHTASGVALVGGGSLPRPGEISMAMHGVLFLDELPEFSRDVLEVLREPLESGRITISRAARQADFPARFQLVAAMNPCPCGYLGHYAGKCHCTPEQVARYCRRISGPLLDRIDIHIEVPAIAPDELAGRSGGESSAIIRARVRSARERQLAAAGQAECPSFVARSESTCHARYGRRTAFEAGHEPARPVSARLPSYSQGGALDSRPCRRIPRRCGAPSRGDPVSARRPQLILRACPAGLRAQ